MKILLVIAVLCASLVFPAHAVSPNDARRALLAVEAAAKAQALRASAMKRAAEVQVAARDAIVTRQNALRAATVQQNTQRTLYAQTKPLTQSRVVGAVANDVNKMNKAGRMTTYSKKGMTLQRSYHQGKLGELVRERNIYAKGNLAVPQVTLKANGHKAVTDFIEYNPRNFSYSFNEVKTGKATYSFNQKAVYPTIESKGGVMSFKGSGGDLLVGPTKVTKYVL